MYRYFCNSCGCKFQSEMSERNENGLLNMIDCPDCGAYDIYQDTEAERGVALKNLLEYEERINDGN